jgi:dihydrofolate reductase
MGRLIYTLNVSVDGFVEAPGHVLDWSTNDDELLGWFAERFRGLEASLYGRRLYETMSAFWPTAGDDPTANETVRAYGQQWLSTPKIVFSSTLTSVDWNSRLVRGDVGEELARLRQEFDGDLEVAGPTLASQFIRRGLVDRYELVVHPVILGAGTPYLPELESRIRLRHTDSRVFASGVTYLGYDVVREPDRG